MSFLTIISGKEVCKILSKIGYEIDHQTGSHIILGNRSFPHRRITVQNHKAIAKKFLKYLLLSGFKF